MHGWKIIVVKEGICARDVLFGHFVDVLCYVI